VLRFDLLMVIWLAVDTRCYEPTESKGPLEQLRVQDYSRTLLILGQSHRSETET
jgi:hypothetical protein